MKPQPEGRFTMPDTPDLLARLTLDSVETMKAEGHLSAVFALPLPDGTVWEIFLQMPQNDRPEALLALSRHLHPTEETDPELVTRLARLASDTRGENPCLFGMYNDKHEPAAAVQFFPDAITLPSLTRYTKALFDALTSAETKGSAEARPEPLNLAQQGWTKV